MNPVTSKQSVTRRIFVIGGTFHLNQGAGSYVPLEDEDEMKLRLRADEVGIYW
jgi:hypothetical protein